MLFDRRRDLLTRQLEALARALARILFGIKRGDDRIVSESLLAEACREALGLDLRFLDAADVPSVVALLRDPDRVRGYAAIVEAQAELETEAAVAAALRARVEALLAAADGG